MKALRLALGLCLAAALATPAMALSLAKPVGQTSIRFSPGDARLAESQQAVLARELPRIEMLALENIVFEVYFSKQQGRQLPTEALARARAAAITEFFVRAGVDPKRVIALTRPIRTEPPAGQDDASFEIVVVDWTGHCKPENGHACGTAYFQDPPGPSAASAASH